MSRTFFDRNRGHLQIHGDVNFFSGASGSMSDNHDYLQVTQRIHATNAHSQTAGQGLKILCQHTAPSARYESDHSFTGPRCHPGTRLAVQDYIVKWLDDADGPIAMWMSGPVGIGKSAIARSVADLAAVRMQLSSAFFFFRTDEARNSSKHLVATLAYEMTQQMPYTLGPVCTAITANPLIFSSPLERQISTVLLQPLTTPDASSSRVPKLIIIDGLDECLDTNIQPIIIRSFISRLLSVSAEIIPHRILIVSRPESHIASAFSAADILPHVKWLSLESWSTEDDIGIFLTAKLDEIRQSHPLRHHLPDIWPDKASLRSLRKQSIGSFAYASVAIRHLASHNDSPERALQDLISLQPRRAAVVFADLDALYRHILLSLDPEMRFLLQKVLCLFVYARCNTIKEFTEFLLEDKVTIEIALIRASSLIEIYDHNQKIKFYHSSFEEFLLNKDRSDDLYVFCPNVASAAATALSSLWLRPVYELYDTFFSMSPRNNDYDFCMMEDMYVCIANTLIATKLPTSFCYKAPRDLDSKIFSPTFCVANFFLSLQEKSQGCSESIHRSIYIQAFTVISDWLRSQFYRFYEGPPTTQAILDIILADVNDTESLTASYPFMYILKELTQLGQGSFYCLHRSFPEIDPLELYSGILDKYQLRILCRDAQVDNEDITDLHYFFFHLYYQICIGVILPGFSHRLEEIVLEGMKALGLVPDLYHYVDPKDCIFRYLYGANCYLDSDYKMVTRDSGYYEPLGKFFCFSLANKTNQYIKKAHKEYDFLYVSQEVEALYRAHSPAQDV